MQKQAVFTIDTVGCDTLQQAVYHGAKVQNLMNLRFPELELHNEEPAEDQYDMLDYLSFDYVIKDQLLIDSEPARQVLCDQIDAALKRIGARAEVTSFGVDEVIN